MIQTYQPENFAIVSAAKNDYRNFYRQESAYRRLLHFPPFSHLLSVEITSRTEEGCISMGAFITGRLKNAFPDLFVAGPTPSPISKIKDIFRYEVVIKDTSYEALIKARKLMDEAIAEADAPKNADLWYDFD
ncbi:MAG: hypothetical protein FRC54_11065 [bacterium LCO1.1]|uniref:Primosomal protein N C-terminal domain-containing protein n=1 Tax=Candidatus Weimeria bifida TaxID=2599074 RepID=A0A6N7J186_9FIRM|nr:hypothetical protein [Candidatus Weimeria bifida]